jgi:ribose transport system substrate-binding protein
MKKVRLFTIIGILVILSVIATACQSSTEAVVEEAAAEEEVVEEVAEEEPAEEAAEETAAVTEDMTFGLVTKALNNPFWEMMHEGSLEVAEANGIELLYYAPTKANNLEEQARLIDDLIAMKADGIVLVPVDSTGIVPAIERANEAGIPVALANTNAAGGEVITFSAVENYDAMSLLTEYAVEKLGEESQVVILEGTAGAQTAIDRKAGVDDTLANYPNIEVLASQTADFQRAQGLTVMENLLQAYPEIDAVIACNDEMALGAVEALDAAGRLEDTMVFGFDGNNDAMKAVYEGRMVATCYQRPEKQAGDAVQALIDYIAGEEVSSRIETEATLIDATNIDDYKDRFEAE